MAKDHHRRNPPWQRDELILALDLYFRHNPAHLSREHAEIERLSRILNDLPIHPTRPDAATFRNDNAVYMKLCNFLRFDPSYSGTGLTRGGSLEKAIWDEFANDPAILRKVAQAIVDGTNSVENLDFGPDEDEAAFPEGRILYRLHRQRERNPTVVREVKRKANATGSLCCAVCQFDFFASYGELGKGFIECHHTMPVSEYRPGQKTKVADLSLVCANCHRMLHRRRPWLTVSELCGLWQSD